MLWLRLKTRGREFQKLGATPEKDCLSAKEELNVGVSSVKEF